MIGAVEPGSPAAKRRACVTGDEIVSIDGGASQAWEDALIAIVIRPDHCHPVRHRARPAWNDR